VRYGVCCSLEDAPKVLEVGFDYVELSLSAVFALDDYKPETVAGLPVEVTNLFFPGGFRLAGLNADDYATYAVRVLPRAAAAGVQVAVIGSGAARKAPSELSVEEAEANFARVVREIQEIAFPLGIRIAPESLNRSETNVGNDLGRLAHAMLESGAGYTADSYHVLWEWNADGPPEASPSKDYWAAQLPYLPSHVHAANLHRTPPEPDDPQVQGFAARLRELGYDGRVSLEANRIDGSVAELRRILTNLRALFEA